MASEIFRYCMQKTRDRDTYAHEIIQKNFLLLPCLLFSFLTFAYIKLEAKVSLQFNYSALKKYSGKLNIFLNMVLSERCCSHNEWLYIVLPHQHFVLWFSMRSETHNCLWHKNILKMWSRTLKPLIIFCIFKWQSQI